MPSRALNPSYALCIPVLKVKMISGMPDARKYPLVQALEINVYVILLAVKALSIDESLSASLEALYSSEKAFGFDRAMINLVFE